MLDEFRPRMWLMTHSYFMELRVTLSFVAFDEILDDEYSHRTIDIM